MRSAILLFPLILFVGGREEEAAVKYFEGAEDKYFGGAAGEYFEDIAAADCNTTAREFRCFNGRCIPQVQFCNGFNNCGDNSDLNYCNYNTRIYDCPENWVSCKNRIRCIPSYYWCDGAINCLDGSDEKKCGNVVERVDGASAAKENLTNWFLQQKTNDSVLSRWGQQVNRIAVALFLSDKMFFSPNNATGREITYENTISLFNKNETLPAQELALFVQSLLVTCVDIRKFSTYDLPQALRKKMEAGSTMNSVLPILALCNAKANMNQSDVDKVTEALKLDGRRIGKDYKALATMALSCLSTVPGLNVDPKILNEQFSMLRKGQQANGTVDNLRSTALVVQALLFKNNFNGDGFNLNKAVKALIAGQADITAAGRSASLLDAYYILPALSYSSLLNVNNEHCKEYPKPDDDTVVDNNEDTIVADLYVWMGAKANLKGRWSMTISKDETAYDLVQKVDQIDPRLKARFDMDGGKPYVSSLMGREDDVEMGSFWSLYNRTKGSDDDPTYLELSPAEVPLDGNQDVIYWYKAEDPETTTVVTASTDSKNEAPPGFPYRKRTHRQSSRAPKTVH